MIQVLRDNVGQWRSAKSIYRAAAEHCATFTAKGKLNQQAVLHILEALRAGDAVRVENNGRLWRMPEDG